MGMSLDSGGGKGAKPNINVTPLVDVVLVLLIIFMVIIPNVQDGKPIEMVNVFNPDKDRDEKLEPITVTISRDKIISVEDEDLSRNAALARLQQVYQESPKRKILVRGDAQLPYSVVRDLFADIQQIGFGGVALAVNKSRSWTDAGN